MERQLKTAVLFQIFAVKFKVHFNFIADSLRFQRLMFLNLNGTMTRTVFKCGKMTLLTLVIAVSTRCVFGQAEKQDLHEQAATYEFLAFEVGHKALKVAENTLAKRIFAKILSNDEWAEDYDVTPFLAEAYRRLGKRDSAEVAYSRILTLLEDLVFFHPEVQKYQERLKKVKEWRDMFPEFPPELLEENGFTPENEPPVPKDGWKSIKRNLKYPKSVLKTKMQGRVILQILIDETGKAIEFKVLESFHTDANQTAIESVKDVEWTIPKKRGRASPLWVAIPFIFQHE